jgi:WD40 repeat protein
VIPSHSVADLDELIGHRVGEFTLRSRIGEGGHGAVYLSEQPRLGRRAAVKILHQRVRSPDPDLLRFLDEARLAARVVSDSAVHVYDVGFEPTRGLLWIAMEHVDGVTLYHWLRDRGPMPVEQFVPFFERVAEVVQAAHGRGVVHRDLKPSNVMVINADGKLLPKLLDFGIAKLLGQLPEPSPVAMSLADLTVGPRTPSASPAIGSPPYMAPEQWSNAINVGPSSDLYALGIIAYEALTGRRPFGGAAVAELVEQHCRGRVPPLAAKFPPALDRFFERALAKRPEDRWSTATDLAAALRAASGLSAHAPRPPRAPVDAARDHLWTSARQWNERGRPVGQLWRGRALADAARVIGISEVETAFLASGRRHAARVSWTLRAGAAVAAAATLAAIQYRTVGQRDLAQEQALESERMVTQAEVEQGRAALLHNELAEARLHLAEAWRRGDRSPDVAFMLGRASQPLRAELARFTAATGRIWSASFSPDGRRVVTTDERSAQVWDAATGARLLTLTVGDVVYDARWTADGARLVTAGGDGAARIWDAATGALVRALRHGTTPVRYYLLALSPDGRTVAAADMDGAVAVVWDATTGSELAALPGDGSGFPSLAFSADGRWIAASGGDRVDVVETATWTRALALSGPGIHALGWDPTGPRLATGSTPGDASIWDVPSGTRAHHLREVGDPVDKLAFAPDGSAVVTAARDGAEQIWDAATGQPRSHLNELHARILSIEFDPSSRLTLATGDNGTAVIADAEQGMPIVTIEEPAAGIRAAHFDPSGSRVVGASRDGTARVWDATPPYRRFASTPIAEDCGIAAALEPDRRYVAVGCRGHETRIWDTASDHLLAELPTVTEAPGDFSSAFPAVSIAGDRAAIARGNTVEVYELPGGRLLRTVVHAAAVNAVAFGPAGHDLVSGAVDGSLLVTRDGVEPVAMPVAGAGIDAAALLPGGVVVSAAGTTLRIIEHGVVVAALEIPSRTRMLRVSAGGHRMITIPRFGPTATPVLWDLDRQQRIAALVGHAGYVFAARFSGDETTIVTAGGDGTARTWDGRTGAPRQTYRSAARFLGDATLDGSMVIAGDSDGQLRFWDLETGRQLWTMLAHTSYVVGIHMEGGDIVTRGYRGDTARWRVMRPE